MMSTVSAVTGLPWMNTVAGPENFSGRMPFRCRSTVDLPAPLGPISPTHSPSATLKLTSCRAFLPSG